MNANLIKCVTFTATSALCLGLIYSWLIMPIDTEQMSLPGGDKVPEGARNASANIKIGEFFDSFDPSMIEALNAKWAGIWPHFRGADMSNIVRDCPPLTEQFDDMEGRMKWKIALGEGHSAPVVYKGVVYLLDYSETEKADVLRAFSLEDGKELWRRWYKIDIKRNHGFSRTIPAVNEDVVVCIGPKCQVMAVDRKSGDLLWSIDMVQEYGAEIPQWYTGQCPIIEDGVVLLAPAGPEVLVMGVDAKTGEVLWKTPNPEGWRMSHASLIPMLYEGKRSYVYSAIGGVAGISAEAADKGAILWSNSEWAPSVVAPTPVPCGEGKVYLTAGYGAGGAMLQVQGDQAKLISRHKPNEGFSIEQQSAILHEGRLYGVMPKDAGFRRMQFMGVPVDNLKDFVVSAPRDLRFGLGPYIMADGKFYVLNDSGSMSIFKVEGDTCKVLDSTQLIKGQDAWGPIAYADGMMIMRDSVTMFCIDMRKERK